METRTLSVLSLGLLLAATGCDKQIDISETPRHEVPINLGGTMLTIEVMGHLQPEGGGTDAVTFTEEGGQFAAGTNVQVKRYDSLGYTLAKQVKGFEEAQKADHPREIVSKQELEGGYELVTMYSDKQNLQVERLMSYDNGVILCRAQHKLRGTQDTIAIEPSAKTLAGICASIKVQDT